jgi:hypothetical protein
MHGAFLENSSTGRDKVCQCRMAGLWCYLGTDRNCITEILLKVALSTIRLEQMPFYLNTNIL